MSKGRRCDFIMERNSDLSSLPSKSNEGILLFGHLTSKMGDLIFDYANKIVLVSAFTAMPWVLALYQSMESIVGIIFT